MGHNALIYVNTKYLFYVFAWNSLTQFSLAPCFSMFSLCDFYLCISVAIQCNKSWHNSYKSIPYRCTVTPLERDAFRFVWFSVNTLNVGTRYVFSCSIEDEGDKHLGKFNVYWIVWTLLCCFQMILWAMRSRGKTFSFHRGVWNSNFDAFLQRGTALLWKTVSAETRNAVTHLHTLFNADPHCIPHISSTQHFGR